MHKQNSAERVVSGHLGLVALFVSLSSCFRSPVDFVMHLDRRNERPSILNTAQSHRALMIMFLNWSQSAGWLVRCDEFGRSGGSRETNS